jgi:hypothetical protein
MFGLVVVVAVEATSQATAVVVVALADGNYSKLI